MAKVRGKFRVSSITTHASCNTYAEITLDAVYTGTPEDNTYAAATPSAQIKMSVTNPEAISELPIGAFFYVDFTPVSEAL